VDILREEVRQTREAMEKSRTSLGLLDAVKQFFPCPCKPDSVE
jgi:hypothetical protein